MLADQWVSISIVNLTTFSVPGMRGGRGDEKKKETEQEGVVPAEISLKLSVNKNGRLSEREAVRRARRVVFKFHRLPETREHHRHVVLRRF